MRKHTVVNDGVSYTVVVAFVEPTIKFQGGEYATQFRWVYNPRENVILVAGLDEGLHADLIESEWGYSFDDREYEDLMAGFIGYGAAYPSVGTVELVYPYYPDEESDEIRDEERQIMQYLDNYFSDRRSSSMRKTATVVWVHEENSPNPDHNYWFKGIHDAETNTLYLWWADGYTGYPWHGNVWMEIVDPAFMDDLGDEYIGETNYNAMGGGRYTFLYGSGGSVKWIEGAYPGIAEKQAEAEIERQMEHLAHTAKAGNIVWISSNEPDPTHDDWFKCIYDYFEDTLYVWFSDGYYGHPYHSEAFMDVGDLNYDPRDDERDDPDYETDYSQGIRYTFGYGDNGEIKWVSGKFGERMSELAERAVAEYMQKHGAEEVKLVGTSPEWDWQKWAWEHSWIWAHDNNELIIDNGQEGHYELIRRNPDILERPTSWGLVLRGKKSESPVYKILLNWSNNQSGSTAQPLPEEGVEAIKEHMRQLEPSAEFIVAEAAAIEPLQPDDHFFNWQGLEWKFDPALGGEGIRVSKDGERIATLTWTERDDVINLNSAFVVPEYREQGIMSMMLDWLISEIPGKPLTGVFAEDSAMRRLVDKKNQEHALGSPEHMKYEGAKTKRRKRRYEKKRRRPKMIFLHPYGIRDPSLYTVWNQIDKAFDPAVPTPAISESIGGDGGGSGGE